MTPYYADEFVTLYHGDCRDVREWLVADVLVMDPPYGIHGGRIGSHCAGRTVLGDAKWDSLAVRDAALAMWGNRPRAVFGSPRRLDAAIEHVEAPLVWDKGESPGMGRIDWPFGVTYELIYVAGEGWAGKRRGGIIRVDHNSSVAGASGHPTQKPLALIEQLLAFAPTGSIADPFAGSGTTLVAAKNLGRRAVGVEISERYCELAAQRLSQNVLDFGGVA